MELDFLRELWNVAIQLIEIIGDVWDWLIKPLEIDVSIPIKIPIILENGINWSWDVGITPISLLGVALIGLVIYWIVWA